MPDQADGRYIGNDGSRERGAESENCIGGRASTTLVMEQEICIQTHYLPTPMHV